MNIFLISSLTSYILQQENPIYNENILREEKIVKAEKLNDVDFYKHAVAVAELTVSDLFSREDQIFQNINSTKVTIAQNQSKCNLNFVYFNSIFSI